MPSLLNAIAVFRVPQPHEPGRARPARSVAGTRALRRRPLNRNLAGCRPPQYLRSPIDYRVIFSKVGGWQMMMLLAGD
jgi:hypothetical protein